MSQLSSRRRVFVAVVGSAAVLALTACGASTGVAGSSSSASSQAAGSSAAASSAAGSAVADPGGPTTVTVTITADKGCVTEPDSIAAGAVTFEVKNVDATGVTEVHLVDDQRIRGERENLAPGFNSSFSANLSGGAYQIYCPGASPSTTNFTVTGTSASASSASVATLLQQATVDYADYVDSQIAYLVQTLPALQTAVAKGDLAAAQKAYAAARPYYEKVEPVAESFGDLDPDIDARAGDVPAGQWQGFHRVEQALFVTKSTAAAQPFIAPLIADVAKLRTLAGQLTVDTKSGDGKGYKPDEVANGAADLLGEVQKSKITGEEERYSHIDILDFAANVEGSEQAFAVLIPALNTIDPSLSTPISTRFAALTALLDSHRDPASLGGVKLYTQLSKDDIKKLADAVLAVQEPLSKISAKVASA